MPIILLTLVVIFGGFGAFAAVADAQIPLWTIPAVFAAWLITLAVIKIRTPR